MFVVCAVSGLKKLFKLHSVEAPAHSHVFDAGIDEVKVALSPEQLQRIVRNTILNGPITPPNPDEDKQRINQQFNA